VIYAQGEQQSVTREVRGFTRYGERWRSSLARRES